MKILEVVPARHWRNRVTCQTASLTGAVPWTSERERGHWELATVGYTWVCDNGTIGIGRPPAATRQEAEAVMQAWNGGTVARQRAARGLPANDN